MEKNEVKKVKWMSKQATNEVYLFQTHLAQILVQEKTVLIGALHILLVFKYSEKYVDEIIAVPQFSRKLP
jgi:hypothetical protein